MAYLSMLVVRLRAIKPPMALSSLIVDKLAVTAEVFAVACRHGGGSFSLSHSLVGRFFYCPPTGPSPRQ